MTDSSEKMGFIQGVAWLASQGFVETSRDRIHVARGAVTVVCDSDGWYAEHTGLTIVSEYHRTPSDALAELEEAFRKASEAMYCTRPAYDVEPAQDDPNPTTEECDPCE